MDDTQKQTAPIPGYYNIPVHPGDQPVVPVGEIGKPAEETSQPHIQDHSQVSELEALAAARSLGLRDFKDMRRYQDQVTRIVEWAHAEGAKTNTDIQAKIHTLKDIVGHSASVYEIAVVAGLKLEQARISQQLQDFGGKK